MPDTTNDRWKRIESLFHAARERAPADREAFLQEACAGDSSLHDEVASLLVTVGASFVDRGVEGVMSLQGGPSLTGRQLGPYAVGPLLGAGGMGEVYRARDTKLGRNVAIKILSARWLADADRITRFEREARLLASLNHPHIAAIYGFEDSGSTHALVLELVEGPTLADRISAGALPEREAVAVARQLADALDAAHERGIVHRDLKPSNIKVTGEGVVKVLDFGLAKAIAGDDAAPDLTHSPTVTVGGTREGVLLGTAAYMSPEQARGRVVDKRADIWAFGCVLFEMLTGQQAFSGDTLSHTIVAILEHEPDWTRLPASTSAGARRLLGHCLQKDPRRRLRDIGDAAAALEAAAAVPAAGARTASAGGAWSVVAWLLLASVVAAGAAFMAGRGTTRPSLDVSSSYDAEFLTNDPGYTGQPALSPDGRLLAYASDREGRGDMDIWVQQTTGGTPLRVTDDDSDDSWPDFSPDGSQIVFRSERNGGGIYVVAALGGAARLVAAGGRNPRFSPDGTRIAYWSGAVRGEIIARLTQVYVVSLSGGAPVRVLPDFQVASMPVWSPDGRGLLVPATPRRLQADEFDWWFAPIDGSAPRRTGIMDYGSLRADANRQNLVYAGSWLPTGFTVNDAARLLLFDLSADGRRLSEPRVLRSGVGTFGTPTMSHDGQIVFPSMSEVRTIERLPLGKPSEEATELYRDANNVAWRASVSRDGGMMVFEREAAGRREIWQKNLSTGDQRLIQQVPTTQLVDATVSPDGSRVTYVVPQAGAAPDTGNGFAVELAGGVPRPLCEGCTVWGFLPDSQRAIVSDTHVIRFVSESGVSQTAIAAEMGNLDRPSIATDGHAIAFRISSPGRSKTYVAPLTSGTTPKSAWTEIDEPTNTGRPCGWSPDSSTLYLLLDTDGFRDLWGQKVDALGRAVGKPFDVRHLHHTTGVGTSLGNAVTEQGFLYESTRFTGNLWRLLPKVSKK